MPEFMQTSIPLHSEPMTVDVVDNEIVVNGVGVAVSLTRDAARETARRLREAADKADN